MFKLIKKHSEFSYFVNAHGVRPFLTRPLNNTAQSYGRHGANIRHRVHTNSRCEKRIYEICGCLGQREGFRKKGGCGKNPGPDNVECKQRP